MFGVGLRRLTLKYVRTLRRADAAGYCSLVRTRTKGQVPRMLSARDGQRRYGETAVAAAHQEFRPTWIESQGGRLRRAGRGARRARPILRATEPEAFPSSCGDAI
jgi:hypothetical protein